MKTYVFIVFVLCAVGTVGCRNGQQCSQNEDLVVDQIHCGRLILAHQLCTTDYKFAFKVLPSLFAV